MLVRMLILGQSEVDKDTGDWDLMDVGSVSVRAHPHHHGVLSTLPQPGSERDDGENEIPDQLPSREGEDLPDNLHGRFQ